MRLENLLKNVTTPVSEIKGDKFKSEQLAVLDVFEKAINISNDISEYINATRNTASNATGSTFGGIYAKMMRISDWLMRMRDGKGTVEMRLNGDAVTPIDDSEEILSLSNAEYMQHFLYHPFAYEQAVYDMNRRMLKALSKLFPYETALYKSARYAMLALSKKAYLNADTINSIHREMLVYILASQKNSLFDGEAVMTYTDEEGEHKVTNREYYTKVFPELLLKEIANNKELAELPIFKHMSPEIDKKRETRLKISGMGGIETYIKDRIMDSWEGLLRDDMTGVDENGNEHFLKTSLIARDLMMYCFYKYGFNFGPLTFMSFASAGVRKSMYVSVGNKQVPYTDFLNRILNNDSQTKKGLGITNMDSFIASFAKQFILNHLDDNQFSLSCSSKIIRTIVGNALSQIGSTGDSFTINLSNMQGSTAARFLTYNGRGMRIFIPVIKWGQNFYVASVTGPVSDMSMTYRKVIYNRKSFIRGLGRKGMFISYYGDVAAAEEAALVKEGPPAAMPRPDTTTPSPVQTPQTAPASPAERPLSPLEKRIRAVTKWRRTNHKLDDILSAFAPGSMRTRFEKELIEDESMRFARAEQFLKRVGRLKQDESITSNEDAAKAFKSLLSEVFDELSSAYCMARGGDEVNEEDKKRARRQMMRHMQLLSSVYGPTSRFGENFQYALSWSHEVFRDFITSTIENGWKFRAAYGRMMASRSFVGDKYADDLFAPQEEFAANDEVRAEDAEAVWERMNNYDKPVSGNFSKLDDAGADLALTQREHDIFNLMNSLSSSKSGYGKNRLTRALFNMLWGIRQSNDLLYKSKTLDDYMDFILPAGITKEAVWDKMKTAPETFGFDFMKEFLVEACKAEQVGIRQLVEYAKYLEAAGKDADGDVRALVESVKMTLANEGLICLDENGELKDVC